MFVLIFGVSCVGKNALIAKLTEKFGWKYIPTFMTRPLRENEVGKISITREEFSNLEKNGFFVCVNEIHGNLYSTPVKEVGLGITDNKTTWVLDFPLSKRHLLEKYPHLGFVILPESIEQLVSQIKEAKREERLEEILVDYNNNYKDLSEHLNKYPKTFVVINYSGKQSEIAEQIKNQAENLI